ncbi:MAG: amidohydrolase family protein [Kangiellaceae bacterium]|jgi:Tol biopolymer transport system component|nr:amidohydrolase family protein [Kangiellaceae bacterium]
MSMKRSIVTLLISAAFTTSIQAGVKELSNTSNSSETTRSPVINPLLPYHSSSALPQDNQHLGDDHLGHDKGKKGKNAEKAEQEDSKNKGLPLKPERKLQYTAEQGSWMSLDVSPDGEIIVFDLLGDLYSMPIAGGKATRLTSGMAMDMQPRFSPDGKSVVYVSDKSGSENIWILDLAKGEEEAQQLTKDKNSEFQTPEWTPDGKYIVAGKATGLFTTHNLMMYHVDGGKGMSLIEKKPDSLKATGPAFGSDPRYFYFETRNRDWNYNAQFPQIQIARFDRNSNTFATITNQYGSAMRPTLSSDGKYMVYATRYDHETGFILRDMTSGEERWLAYPVQHDEQESRSAMGTMPGYSFSADNKKLIASYGGKFFSIDIKSGAQKNIPFSADVDLDLGPEVAFDYDISDDKSFTARQIRHPALSPNGKKMVFTALNHLYVMDYPNGTPKRLTSSEFGEFMPAWSPDGRTIAFASWDSEKGGHIYRVRSNGRSKPTRLTKQAAVYRNLVFSPDGKRIVAERGAARELKNASGFYGGEQYSEFVWLKPSGGKVTTIMPTQGMYYPHFTQDKNRIFAYGGNQGLVSFRWDGTDMKTHLKVTGKAMGRNPKAPPAALVVMAPKGDQAFALENNQLYTMTVPWTSGKPITVSTAALANAAVPARRLTEIAANFPFWDKDGRTVHWSLANAFFSYNLDDAEAFDKKLEAEKKAEAEKKQGDDSESEQPEQVAESEEDETDTKDNAKDYDKAAEKKFTASERRIVVKGKRDIPQGKLLLTGARLITMNGNEIIEQGDIYIENNRIKAVGKTGSLNVPANVSKRDVSGKTIVPGYVDVHYHSMWLIPELHGNQVWQYLTTLAYGVTTTRDPQTSTTDVLSYADRVENGDMIGPRVYSTGPGVFWSEPLNSYEDAKNALRRYSEYYDTKTFKMYMTGQRKQRQWLIQASKELELMPTTEGGLDIRIDLTHAIDGYPGVEHNLPVYPLYSDVVNLFKASGTVNTPTLLVTYGGPWGENFYYATENVYENAKLRKWMPYRELASRSLRRASWFHKDEHKFSRHAEFIKDLVQAGGSSGVGSHGQIQGIGFHWELWSMQSGGMSNHDALKTATILGAKAIGFAKQLGSIEAGKLADLVILNKNPLDNIRHSEAVHSVMKNGRLYDADSLDQKWPTKQKMAPQSWRNSAPKVKAGLK